MNQVIKSIFNFEYVEHK